MRQPIVKNRLSISDDDFIAAYCQAPNFRDLVRQLGVPSHTVRNRIQSMRKKGVELPDKPRAPRQVHTADPQEIQRLNALVKSFAGPVQ